MSLIINNLICTCFYTNNYFVKRLKLHVSFHGANHFKDSNWKLLENYSQQEIIEIIGELEHELKRRRSLGSEARQRRQFIAKNYTPLNPSIYLFQEDILLPDFRELVNRCVSGEISATVLSALYAVKGADRVYQIPMFTTQFCQEFIEELSHFEDSGMPKGRPNTMNHFGVNLDEVGFDEHLLTPLRELYLSAIAHVLFPDIVGSGSSLDSHRAFTVSYGPSADSDLDLHFDNGEVTANVSLSYGDDSDADGELYFGGMHTEVVPVGVRPSFVSCRHRVGHCVLHRSQQLHGALQMSDGSSRRNLIIWMRSSEKRNKLCPMCDRTPTLVETQGPGDGFFVQQQIEICNVV